MTSRDADIIVVGGGLAGVATAVSLARAGFETIHLAPTAPPDRRTSALMMPSVEFLISAGLIDTPEAVGNPLTSIRIIDATDRLIRAPETLFNATEIGLEAFGWNFANARLLEHFQAAAPAQGLTTRNIAVTVYRREDDLGVVALADGTTLAAPLVVGADGKKSLIRTEAGIPSREHAFAEAALVCDLELARPIGGTSVEFHYPHGPFTLVPAGDKRANLVWIDEGYVLREIQAEGPEALLAAFKKKSKNLFGSLSLASPSFVFPLSVLTVATAGRDGTVLVGESAHAFPPIGAQGLNLGLRDVADLMAALDATYRDAPDWAEKVSADYARRRASDLTRTGSVVDALFRSLLAEMLPAQALRAGGLWALKLLPPLRRTAFGIGMGQRSA